MNNFDPGCEGGEALFVPFNKENSTVRLQICDDCANAWRQCAEIEIETDSQSG